MTAQLTRYDHLAYPPAITSPPTTPPSPGKSSGAKPPREPDWLLIMVAALCLLTLLIVWMVAVPG